MGGAQINGFVIPANAGIYTNTGSPIGSGMTTADSTPTFTGRVTDALMGDVVANKVASGPNSLEVKIEKKNNITNLYTLHSLANVNFTDTYWTDTNEKITDNSKNTYSKYANYSYTPSEELTNGSYKISITGKDLAGNSGGSQVFNLNVGSSYLPHRQAGITPSIWERDGDTTDEDELINQLEEQPDLVVQVPETSLNIFQRLIAFISSGARTIYWACVDTAVTLAHAGGDLARLAMSPFQKGYTFLASNISLPEIPFLTRAINGIKHFASNTGKWITIAREIYFEKEPTTIRNVKVAETGADYVVITWDTNHYTTNNKVNYGTSKDYGQDVVSNERERNHELKITGLTPGTAYNYEVMSQNKNYIYDSNHEFTTSSD